MNWGKWDPEALAKVGSVFRGFTNRYILNCKDVQQIIINTVLVQPLQQQGLPKCDDRRQQVS